MSGRPSGSIRRVSFEAQILQSSTKKGDLQDKQKLLISSSGQIEDNFIRKLFLDQNVRPAATVHFQLIPRRTVKRSFKFVIRSKER